MHVQSASFYAYSAVFAAYISLRKLWRVQKPLSPALPLKSGSQAVTASDGAAQSDRGELCTRLYTFFACCAENTRIWSWSCLPAFFNSRTDGRILIKFGMDGVLLSSAQTGTPVISYIQACSRTNRSWPYCWHVCRRTTACSLIQVSKCVFERVR